MNPIDWGDSEKQIRFRLAIISDPSWGAESKTIKPSPFAPHPLENVVYEFPSLSLDDLAHRRHESLVQQNLARITQAVSGEWALAGNVQGIEAVVSKGEVPLEKTRLASSSFAKDALADLAHIILVQANFLWLGLQQSLLVSQTFVKQSGMSMAALLNVYVRTLEKRDRLAAGGQAQLAANGAFISNTALKLSWAAHNGGKVVPSAEFAMVALAINQVFGIRSALVPPIGNFKQLAQQVYVKKENLLHLHALASNEGFAEWHASIGLRSLQENLVRSFIPIDTAKGNPSQASPKSATNPYAKGLKTYVLAEKKVGFWFCCLMSNIAELPIRTLMDWIPSSDLDNFYELPQWNPNQRLELMEDLLNSLGTPPADPSKFISTELVPRLDGSGPGPVMASFGVFKTRAAILN